MLKWIFKFRRMRRWDADQALDPLLKTVKTAPPPEGLLLEIERQLDETPKSRSLPARWVWGSVLLSATAAALVIALVTLETQTTILLNPAGRPVITLMVSGDTISAKLMNQPASDPASSAWHLWGLPTNSGAPVYLGELGLGELEVSKSQRFQSFAMSLETAGFRGNQPSGLVLVLSPK